MIETEVIGDEKVLLNLEEMVQRASDARPATKKVRDILVEENKKTFESEGGHVSAPWAPLSEETLKRKSREGIDLRPLHGKSGDLEGSMTGGKGKRTGATKKGARAGSGVWYGRLVGLGTKGSASSHNTGIPARKLTGVSRSAAGEILGTVTDWVVHGR